VDAVLIATPHYAHTTIGADALEQGLHVLVEKPISVHKADCERLIAAHRGGRQVFAAMFNQRTDPYYRKIRELVWNGELGEIRRVNWIITNWFRSQAYYDSGDWRATWAGEGDPVAWCERLANRLPIIHRKDYRVDADGKVGFAEVGSGNLDWSRILPAAERAGCAWFCVEQDSCPGDPFDSLQQSYAFLAGRCTS
jgi:hypothetical protein